MANNRANIREAISDLLTGETEAGDNVYTNRETNLWQAELPAILIYTQQESNVPESVQNRRSIRTLELIIKVKLEESSTIDDDVDALIAEVETILNANQSLSGTVISAQHTSTDVSVEPEGEKLVGVGTLTYECKYIS